MYYDICSYNNHRECIPELCRCSKTDPITGRLLPCENTAIQTKRYPRTEVFDTGASGFGLRLLEDIPANTIIVEYLGEVISSEEMVERMRKYKKTDHFYFATLGNGLMLDAGRMGSVARFANHSCQPNSSLQRWTVRNEIRIALVSSQPIPADSEITYQYHFTDDGWKNNPIRSQKCHCRSLFCNGFVGASQKNSFAAVQANELRARQLLASLRPHTAPDQEGDDDPGQPRRSKESILSFLQQSQELLAKLPALPALPASPSSSLGSGEGQVLGSLAASLAEIRTLLDDFLVLEAEAVDFLRSGPRVGGFLSLADCRQLRKRLAASRVSGEAEAELLRMLTAQRKAAKKIRALRERCGLPVDEIALDEEEPAAVDEQGPPPPSASTSEVPVGFVLWDDLIAAASAVLDCFPLACPLVPWLLGLVLESNLFAMAQLLPLVTGTDYFYQADCGPFLRDHQLLQQIARLYLPEMAGDFPKDLFYIANYLSDYLSIYMDKNRLDLVASSSSSSSAPVPASLSAEQQRRLCLGLRPGLKLPETQLVERSSSSSGKKGKGKGHESEEFHCFCHLREEDGENSVMSQCLSCGGWFHLACNNHQTVSLASARQLGDFHCNSCLFRLRRWSPFAFEPASEWKYSKKDLSSAQAIKKHEKRLTSKLLHQSQALALGQAQTQQPSQDVVQAMQLLEKSDVLRAKKKSTNFLSLEDFEKILRLSEGLRLQWSPAASLLNVMKQLLLHWEQKVGRFFDRALPALPALIDPFLATPAQDDEAGGLGDRWGELAQVQREAAGVYFDLQILHLRHPPALDRLRALLWLLAVLPLCQQRRQHSAHFLCLVRGLTESSADDISTIDAPSQPLCRRDELRRATAAGRSLLQKLIVADPLAPLLRSVLGGLDGFEALWSQLSARCLGMAPAALTEPTARRLLALVEQFCRWVDEGESFLWAFVRCLNRPLSRLCCGQDQSVSLAPEQSLYCWCRQGDDGREMICCDSCGDWFHLDCLHRPSNSNSAGQLRKKRKSSTHSTRANRKKAKASLVKVEPAQQGEVVSSEGSSAVEARGIVEASEVLLGMIKKEGDDGLCVKAEPTSKEEEAAAEEEEERFFCISCCFFQGVAYPHRW